MNRYFLLIFLCIFALVGLLDASYILIKEVAAVGNPSALNSCSVSATLSCSTVLTSRYATILGIPVSLLGIFFYKDMLLLGIALILGLPLRRWFLWAVSLFIGASFLFSIYLLAMSYFAIGSFCPLCLVSNTTTLLIAILWFVFLARLPKNAKTA